MEAMRESWTDERLDYFRAETAQRFDAVDKRFDAVERRLEGVESELKALNRTLLQLGGGMITILIAGFFGVIITLL
jgi:tetrahydromethanopterin S-methyltransferase subunit G